MQRDIRVRMRSWRSPKNVIVAESATRFARRLRELPKFDRALADFAAGYADQNERDFEVLSGAVKDGTLASEPGVDTDAKGI